MWSFDSGSPGLRTSDWTANGVTIEDYGFEGAATPTSNDTYKFGIVVAANSQGRIVLQGRKDESTNDFAVFLNALRLETGDTLNPPPSVTDVLRVDFNDRTEGEVRRGEYRDRLFDDDSRREPNAVFDGIEVTISPYGATTLDDRDRTGPVDAGSFSLDQVYDDVIYANDAAGTGMEILIEGLVPNVSYDLLLRSYDFGASGTRQSTWTEESSGQSVVIASPYSH